MPCILHCLPKGCLWIADMSLGFQTIHRKLGAIKLNKIKDPTGQWSFLNQIVSIRNNLSCLILVINIIMLTN